MYRGTLHICQQRMPVNLSSCFQPALQSCVFWLKVIIMSTTTHTLERLQTEDFWGHRGTHICVVVYRVVSAPWRCLYPVHGAGFCIYISKKTQGENLNVLLAKSLKVKIISWGHNQSHNQI